MDMIASDSEHDVEGEREGEKVSQDRGAEEQTLKDQKGNVDYCRSITFISRVTLISLRRVPC